MFLCDALRDLLLFVQFRKRKNANGEVILLVKLQASACNFTKSITPLWVLFTFFELNKWYQSEQGITYVM